VTEILVVEDEEALADTIRYGLEREGYEESIAPDGRAALERFRGGTPPLRKPQH
jgi:DNA-binding response OmpR family regulator